MIYQCNVFRETICIYLYYRFMRNEAMRREAKEEVNRLAHSRIENQLFSTKCSAPAQAVTFHPYDSHVAISVKDNIM